MAQKFWKKVLPFAFVLAFLVACSEDETQSSNLGENDSQSETNTQTEDDTQNENNAQSVEDNDSESDNNNQSNIDSEEETDYGTLLWETYDNMRFAYSISYPSTWIIGEESDNGDGVSLYEGDSDNIILVYGSHYNEDIYDPYSDASKDGFTIEKITLDNGDEADYIVGMEDGKILLKVFFIKDYVEYTFYVKVTREFFDENVDLLVQTAKSLNVKES